MTTTKIRAGLYLVTTENNVFTVENRQSPDDYGNEWLWYITHESGSLTFDPVATKRDALQDIIDFY